VGVLVGVCFVGAGLVLGLFGGSFTFTAQQAQTWPSATATILKAESQPNSGQGGDYTHVKFQFVGTDQKTYQAEGSLSGPYEVGDQIEVRYNPENPAQTVVELSKQRFAGGVGLLLAIPFVALGSYLTFWGLRKIVRRRIDNRAFEAHQKAREARRTARRASKNATRTEE
jgi:hypothetical protein